MDEFADFIQNVELPLLLREEIIIALIDDGVDINEQSLHAKIIGGRSFCQRDKFQNLSKPYCYQWRTRDSYGKLDLSSLPKSTVICRQTRRAHARKYEAANHSPKRCQSVTPFPLFYPLLKMFSGRPSSNRQKGPHTLHVMDP
jgi:hypothetical protein